MKQIDFKHIDQHLGKIKKVAAADYLLTRVHQRIKVEKEEIINSVWAWSLSIPFLILFVLNISLYTSSNDKVVSSKSLVEEMNLLNNNSLYN